MLAEVDAPIVRRGWLRHVAAMARHRHGVWVLAAIAFADSSFLPVPPDLLLVPMALVRPDRLRLLLAVCTLSSSLGAAVGYLIGYALWTTIGAPLVQLYGYPDQVATFQLVVQDWGVWIIIGKAFTPIPFKIAAIGAGLAGMPLTLFMVAAVLGRALHFAMLGALIVLCGARLTKLVTRYERPLAVVSVVAVIALAVIYHLR